MRKFIIQSIAFAFPLIILLGIPTYILWKSKENFFKIDGTLSVKDKYLIGYSYHENNYGYIKWSYLSLNESKSVWALGSSRVLQFREEMFESTFYNAGYTVSSITDFKQFMKSLPDSKHPKYIIIGLDQWMFNESYDALNSITPIESWKNSFTFSPKLFPTYKAVYADLFAGKCTFKYLLQYSNSYNIIGLNAGINGTGFRNDGSIYYGEQIKKLIDKDSTANDFRYLNTLDRIMCGNRRFQYCDVINEKAISELNELLIYCKGQKINVVAFLPPFADKVFNKMDGSGKYAYLKLIHNRIKPYFDKYGFEVYDFSSASLCNSDDNEMIDGFHGGELSYQKILISMLDSGSILNRVANIDKLKIDLKNKKNNYTIYDN